MGAVFETILGSDAWARSLAVVLDAGAKSLILLALAWMLALAMRRSSASARHLLWTLALTGLLVLPVLSILMPKWQIPILPQGETVSVQQPEQLLAPVQTPVLTTIPQHQPALPATDFSPAPVEVIQSPMSPTRPVTNLPTLVPASVPTPVIQEAEPTIQITLAQSLFAAWLVIALMVLAPLVAGMWAVNRLQRRSESFTSQSLLELLPSLTKSLGIRSSVQLRCAGTETMPMAAGIWRSIVFLPSEVEEWTEEKRRVVLLHELAHVKRRDCLTHALARVVLALYWFNPLAWMALRFQRIERERACDDLVLTAGEQPAVYADQLLEIARSMRTGSLTSAAAITMAKRSQLEGRLLAVLDPLRNRRSIRWWAGVLGALLLMAVSIPLGMTELSAREDIVGGGEDEEVEKSLFTVVYENGVKATVMAITEDGQSPAQRIWSPDGKLLNQLPEGFDPYQFSDGKIMSNRLYLYVKLDKPEGMGTLGNKWTVDGAGGSSSVSFENQSNREYLDLQTTVDPDKETVSLKLGLAAKEWETVIEGTPGQGSSQGTDGFAFSEASIQDGFPSLVVSHTLKDCNFRIVYLDSNGKVTTPSQTSYKRVGNFYQCQIRFPKSVTLDTDSRIAIQKRGYEFQEIPGIVVKPDDNGFSDSYHFDFSSWYDESALVEARDDAATKGKILVACEAEMRRVKLREETGNLYKDKIDLVKIYEKSKEADPERYTEEHAIEVMGELKEYADRHQQDPDYGWRIIQLSAEIVKDQNKILLAFKYMENAMKAYPEVTYPEPSKHSKYQHLVNQTCELVWMSDGMEVAESYLVKRWNDDPKFVSFFDHPWKEWYRQNGQSLDRLVSLKRKLKDKSGSSKVIADVTTPYTAVYQSGITATVVAVAEDKGTPNRKVWAADGTALDEAPSGYTESTFKSYRNGYLRRDFYVQVDKPEGTGWVGDTWRVDGEGGRSNFGTYHPSDETKDFLAIRTIVKPGTQTSTLRLGLAAGPWGTVYKGAIDTEWTDGITRVSIGKVEKKQNTTWLDLVHNIQEKNIRVVSYDKKGTLSILPCGFHGEKGIYTGTVFLRDAYSPENISTIAIQARDYEYQEIPGIVVQTEDYGFSEIVYDGSTQFGEATLAYDRDRAIDKGKILLACEAEMGRVKARDRNGNLYKDKIDLSKIYQKTKDADPMFDAGTRYLEVVELLRKYAAQHSNDPDYGWRIWHLCAVIMKEHHALTPAIYFFEEAMRKYPYITYPDPSKHSKYQHLVNQTCELVWMRDGMEAAEGYLLKRWSEDTKFVYFFPLPWEELYRQNGESLDRLEQLKSQMKDKSRASVALSREALSPDPEELSNIHDEAKLIEIRQMAFSKGDIITACIADIQRAKVRGANGNMINGEFYHKDRMHLTVSIRREQGDDPDDLVMQLEQLASQHTDDPEYGWRIWHLCADIMDDDGNLDQAIHYMKKSVEAYPDTTYTDPAQHSMLQFLINRLCMMIWDRDGREISEAHLINCWRSDPRFVYFAEYSWRNKYQRMTDPSQELEQLKERMGEKPSLDNASATGPLPEVNKPKPNYLSAITNEPELVKLRDEAAARGDLIAACEAEMRRVKVRGENGNLYKDKIDLTGIDRSKCKETPEELIDQLKAYAEDHADDPDYGWRICHLCADINMKSEMLRTSWYVHQAIAAYPNVQYTNPAKHSKFQHLVNDFCLFELEKNTDRSVDEKLLKYAEYYLVSFWRNDSRFVHFHDLPWRQMYQKLGLSESRLNKLIDVMGDKSIRDWSKEKGQVVFDEVTPVFAEKDDATVGYVQFSRSGTDINAAVNLKHLSGPKKYWRVTLKLEVDNNSPYFARDVLYFENSGSIRGRAGIIEKDYLMTVSGISEVYTDLSYEVLLESLPEKEYLDGNEQQRIDAEGWGEKAHGIRLKLDQKPLTEDTTSEGFFHQVVADFWLWAEYEGDELNLTHTHRLEKAIFQIDGINYTTEPLKPGDHWPDKNPYMEPGAGKQFYSFILKIQDDMVLVQPYRQDGDFYYSSNQPVKLVIPSTGKNNKYIHYQETLSQRLSTGEHTIRIGFPPISELGTVPPVVPDNDQDQTICAWSQPVNFEVPSVQVQAPSVDDIPDVSAELKQNNSTSDYQVGSEKITSKNRPDDESTTLLENHSITSPHEKDYIQTHYKESGLKSYLVCWQAIVDEQALEHLNLEEPSSGTIGNQWIGPVNTDEFLQDCHLAIESEMIFLPHLKTSWYNDKHLYWNIFLMAQNTYHHDEKNKLLYKTTLNSGASAKVTDKKTSCVIVLDQMFLRANLEIMTPDDYHIMESYELAPLDHILPIQLQVKPNQAFILAYKMEGSTSKSFYSLTVIQSMDLPKNISKYVIGLKPERFLAEGRKGLVCMANEALEWESSIEQKGIISSVFKGSNQRVGTGSDQAEIVIERVGNVTDDKDIKTPRIDYLAVGNPGKWPHKWWGIEGHPVVGYPGWNEKRSEKGERFCDGKDIRVVYQVKDKKDQVYGQVVEVDENATLRLFTGHGQWEDVTEIKDGEEIDIDGLTVKFSMQGQFNSLSVQWKEYKDPDFEIQVMAEDKQGRRKLATGSCELSSHGWSTSKGEGCDSGVRMRSTSSGIEEMDVARYVVVKRPLAEFQIKNLPMMSTVK